MRFVCVLEYMYMYTSYILEIHRQSVVTVKQLGLALMVWINDAESGKDFTFK